MWDEDAEFHLFEKLPEEIREQIITHAISINDELQLYRTSNDGPRNGPNFRFPHDSWGTYKGPVENWIFPVKYAGCHWVRSPCRELPIDLYLVNRRFGALAKRIFTFETEFRFTDCWLGDSVKGQAYIEKISTALMSLQNLRWLSLSLTVFPDPENGIEKWRNFANSIRSTRTQQMALSLYLDSLYLGGRNACGENHGTEPAAWAMEQTIVEHFKGLSFRDFYVSTTSPDYDTLKDDKLRWSHEHTLEKYVMGDTYNAGPEKYRYAAINEEKGPRRFWHWKICLRERHAKALGLDLDDPLTQERLMRGDYKNEIDRLFREPD